MAARKTKTVITGMGLISPIGIGPDDYWQSLAAGRSGVRPISLFDASGHQARIAGEIPDFDAKQYLEKKDRKSLKMMARSIQLGVAASLLAIKDASLNLDQEDPARIGIDFGASLIASDLDEMAAAAKLSAKSTPGQVDMQIWGTQGLATMPPLWMLKYLPNMPACHVSILCNLQGPSNTITENDVAGLLSVAEGQRILERGNADVMLTGGSDSRVNTLSLTRLTLFHRFSSRNGDPERACRPFDVEADGFVIGEGSAILVLETADHAQKRNARVYGTVLGCGASHDRKRDGSGLARAIEAALRASGVSPADLDHVNAQGYGHPDFDRMEAAGLKAAFGAAIPPVAAYKGFFGNLGAAASTAELAVSLLAFQHGSLPASLNCDQPITADLPAVRKSRPIAKNCFLKLSFSDMGQCCAAVIGRPDGQANRG